MRIVLGKVNTKRMITSVVLAEDNLEHCFFFKKALKDVAPQVKFADVHDGDKLIELMDSYIPDLLFLDLGMPCRNGVQCIREIRSHRTYDAVPIIVFSVTSDADAIQTAYASGANLYIIKPEEYSLLKLVLSNILSMDWGNSKLITEKHFHGNRYLPFSIRGA